MNNATAEIHHIDWQGRSIEIRYCRNWSNAYEEIYGHPVSHLEVEAVQPAKSPLPITETGYRSFFTTADDIEAAGGPVPYVQEWLKWASQSEEWKASDLRAQQLSLF